MAGMRAVAGQIGRSRAAQLRLEHKRALELARANRGPSANRTPGAALRKRLGLTGDEGGPRTLAGNAPPTQDSIKRKKKASF